ncbi:MAG: NYN domain-containing protein [Clostridium sp.]
MKTFFIDGYNVINSWPNLKYMKEVSFEGARQGLIDTLQDYSSYKGYKIILVFDAYLVKGAIEQKEIYGNLVVIFTKHGQTADSYIEKSVNKIGRKIDITVVTSDSLQQQIIFQRGASRKSSLEFYHDINSVNSIIRKKINTDYSIKRNLLEDIIESDEVREKLDIMRKST